MVNCTEKKFFHKFPLLPFSARTPIIETSGFTSIFMMQMEHSIVLGIYYPYHFSITLVFQLITHQTRIPQEGVIITILSYS